MRPHLRMQKATIPLRLFARAQELERAGWPALLETFLPFSSFTSAFGPLTKMASPNGHPTWLMPSWHATRQVTCCESLQVASMQPCSQRCEIIILRSRMTLACSQKALTATRPGNYGSMPAGLPKAKHTQEAARLRWPSSAEPSQRRLSSLEPASQYLPWMRRQSFARQKMQRGIPSSRTLDALAVFSAGVFGLLLDTSSKVRDFAGPKSRSMLAGARRKRTKLFPPNIWLWTFEIIKLPTELEGILKRTPPRQPMGGSSGFTWNPFARVFDAGPLYGAIVTALIKASTQPMEPTAILSRSLSLCRSRLSARPEMVTDRCGVSQLIMAEELCFTLLVTRLTISSLQRAGLERFVLSNMATLIAVSKDANVISAKFVVEPLLAIAALLEMDEEGSLDLLLRTLANMMVSGGVSNIFATGKAGEFVASAIFTFAYDRALACLLSTHPETSYVGMPISVGAYLEALLGSEAVASVVESCALLKASKCIL